MLNWHRLRLNPLPPAFCFCNASLSDAGEVAVLVVKGTQLVQEVSMVEQLLCPCLVCFCWQL